MTHPVKHNKNYKCLPHCCRKAWHTTQISNNITTANLHPFARESKPLRIWFGNRVQRRTSLIISAKRDHSGTASGPADGNEKQALQHSESTTSCGFWLPSPDNCIAWPSWRPCYQRDPIPATVVLLGHSLSMENASNVIATKETFSTYHVKSHLFLKICWGARQSKSLQGSLEVQKVV